ncbi:hypothetical protein P5705_05195 [Pseudomonas entomophila]|uniref:hypothetical protein n=1 Tax=Pseudomonas entomophila TaxID=312306 RepID=UPI002405CF8C|nr:hypothetical protein [Pseudomonas entomophila]MDF9617029.1 hypothetical protein [Pseudomonas entomophila]
MQKQLLESGICVLRSDSVNEALDRWTLVGEVLDPVKAHQCRYVILFREEKGRFTVDCILEIENLVVDDMRQFYCDVTKRTLTLDQGFIGELGLAFTGPTPLETPIIMLPFSKYFTAFLSRPQ